MCSRSPAVYYYCNSRNNLSVLIAACLNDNPSVDEQDGGQRFVAFARVFSGTVRRGQTLYVLGPKHNPVTALKEVTVI